jgi:ribose 5-phosphate isomerase A
MEIAKKAGIPLADINDKSEIDVTIDGADEVAPNLDIVKGRMGGILRKKMIGMASKKYICIADETKLVDGIGGSKGALPVEVTQFGYKHVESVIRKLPSLKVAKSVF